MMDILSTAIGLGAITFSIALPMFLSDLSVEELTKNSHYVYFHIHGSVFVITIVCLVYYLGENKKVCAGIFREIKLSIQERKMPFSDE